MVLEQGFKQEEAAKKVGILKGTLAGWMAVAKLLKTPAATGASSSAELAAQNKRPVARLIHHPNRGNQYCARDYCRMVEQFEMQASMSRRGNCYDNAPRESLWGSLKSVAWTP